MDSCCPGEGGGTAATQERRRDSSSPGEGGWIAATQVREEGHQLPRCEGGNTCCPEKAVETSTQIREEGRLPSQIKDEGQLLPRSVRSDAYGDKGGETDATQVRIFVE
jgi:hypothetical protein